MNAIQDDPESQELERALMLWLSATGDLTVLLERQRGSAPVGRRIVLDVLDKHLEQARSAALSAFAVALFSSR